MNATSLHEQGRQAVALIPRGRFIMTAAFDEHRAGVLVQYVQLCAPEPPHVAVSMLRGQSLEPLMRDSRAFALCQISADDRFLERKFQPNEGLPGTRQCATGEIGEEVIEDQFVSIPVRPAPSGSPIIERAMSWLDCELVRTVDLDPDHRLYVGRVTAGGVLNAKCSPAVVFGVNGTSC